MNNDNNPLRSRNYPSKSPNAGPAFGRTLGVVQEPSCLWACPLQSSRPIGEGMRGKLFLVCLGRSAGWRGASFRQRSRRGQRSWARGSPGGPSWRPDRVLFCVGWGKVSDMGLHSVKAHLGGDGRRIWYVCVCAWEPRIIVLIVLKAKNRESGGTYKAYCIAPSFFSWLGKGTSLLGFLVTPSGGPPGWTFWDDGWISVVADLVEEEEMNAQGPARMSAVDDGLTAFNVISPPLCGMDMYVG